MTCLGAIDLGTNTIRLLVVEVAEDRSWRPVAETQTVARLGEGLLASGRLGEVAMERALATAAEFCDRARALGAERMLVVGTSALREAANRLEFLERLTRATGQEVRVVPGEDEGHLTLLGVLHGLPALSGSLLVFDIGGGSTEFILARHRRFVLARSLALGVVPLAERYMTAGPVDWLGYRDLDREVRDLLARELRDLLPGPRPDQLIGTAGTVTTLAALDQALPEYNPQKVHGYLLHRHRIEELLATLGALPVAARATFPCLEPGRADVIIPGIAICLAAMDAFGVSSLLVSEFGLREGILIDYLSRSAP
ncbi:MAG: Ppx/GppA family phosphatase [Candidatus Rokubacteria bacterium]|nr:Ppx/GppA family phosphatase [Candidatus Rokubacteria bacterium]